jgi:hypothetical protein
VGSIIINCPNCSRPNSIDSQHIGKNARCGACQSVFRVPDGSQPVANKPQQAAGQPSPPPASSYTAANYPGAAQTPYSTASPPPPYPTASPPPPYSPASPPPPYPTAAPPPPEFLQNLSTLGPTGFRCPFCQATAGVYTKDQISTGGWVVFAVLLITCWPLFWIGLLIKEQTTHCCHCHLRIG